MPSNRIWNRVLPAIALIATLVLASLPAQAQPVRRPATGLQAVTACGENGLSRIWHFVVSLWPRGVTKEGMSIDPNGNHGATTNPGGDLIDEGTSIDPDGRQ